MVQKLKGEINNLTFGASLILLLAPLGCYLQFQFKIGGVDGTLTHPLSSFQHWIKSPAKSKLFMQKSMKIQGHKFSAQAVLIVDVDLKRAARANFVAFDKISWIHR